MAEPLEELIGRLRTLDPDHTIYATRDPEWSPKSLAVAALEPDDGSIPPEATNLEYLLEVSLAVQVLDWLLAEGRNPSRRELAEAVIHYAKFDTL